MSCQFPAALSMSILTNSSMPCGSPMASARFSACERTWTKDSVKSRNGNSQSKISPSQTAAKLDLTFGLLIGVKKVKPKSSSKISNNFAWNLKPLAVCESKIGSKSKVHLQLIFFPECSSKNNWKKTEVVMVGPTEISTFMVFSWTRYSVSKPIKFIEWTHDDFDNIWQHLIAPPFTSPTWKRHWRFRLRISGRSQSDLRCRKTSRTFQFFTSFLFLSLFLKIWLWTLNSFELLWTPLFFFVSVFHLNAITPPTAFLIKALQARRFQAAKPGNSLATFANKPDRFEQTVTKCENDMGNLINTFKKCVFLVEIEWYTVTSRIIIYTLLHCNTTLKTNVSEMCVNVSIYNVYVYMYIHIRKWNNMINFQGPKTPLIVLWLVYNMNTCSIFTMLFIAPRTLSRSLWNMCLPSCVYMCQDIKGTAQQHFPGVPAHDGD